MTAMLCAIGNVFAGPGCIATDHATTAGETTVRLKAVGDIVLGTDWPAGRYPHGFEDLVRERLSALLAEADIVFGNLEGVLTTHDKSTKKVRPGRVYAFRMPPRFAPLLGEAGFGVLSVANNHSNDFGTVGYEDTLKHLSAHGLIPVGEKGKIALQRIKDVTLAWIGFGYQDRLNDMHDDDVLAQLITQAREQADVVVVSVHAGAEGSDALRVVAREEVFLGERRGDVVNFARRAVDLGADLVLGHGPHVLRGMECYKGRLIAYSLGNFIGYGAFSTRRAAAISAVLQVTLSRQGQVLDYDVLPLKFDEDGLPEVDAGGLARHLINDLSRRPPLNATAQVHVSGDSHGYQEWLSAAALRGQLEAEPHAEHRLK